jgi:hypothetical protein
LASPAHFAKTTALYHNGEQDLGAIDGRQLEGLILDERDITLLLRGALEAMAAGAEA